MSFCPGLQKPAKGRSKEEYLRQKNRKCKGPEVVGGTSIRPVWRDYECGVMGVGEI